jgi:hypothetical protein
MRLFIDGDLIGEALVDGAIPPVKGAGVSIGNSATGDGEQFPGAIDEVTIWRRDPRMMRREFLGRPFTPQAAACWQSLAEAVLAWRGLNEGRFLEIVGRSTNQRDRLLRAIYLLPEGDQAKLRAAQADFAKLWFAGSVKGPEMRRVLCDWVGLLRSFGVDPWSDPEGNILWKEIASLPIDGGGIAKCDKDFAAFAEMLAEVVATCGIGG